MQRDNIQEAKRKRFQFLHRLYEITQGSQTLIIDVFKLGSELGFNREETNRITDYLRGEGLMKFQTSGGGAITHDGVVQVERALSEPDQPTEYFPPANFIYVERMVGSQIQQGTYQSAQAATFSQGELEAVASFVQSLKSNMPELDLEPEAKAEAESEVASIEAQLNSPRPKTVIIQECLQSLRAILEGLAGNLIAGMLLEQISGLLYKTL
jgi:hypothetical protein